MSKQDKNNKAEVPSMHLRESKAISGLYVIERNPGVDERGFFREVYRKSVLEENGIVFNPVQMNHSVSETSVIRAIHAEKWNKLVYPLTGRMWAAIVDLREESSAFGKYDVFEFDNTRGNLPDKALFIPKGMGNSICALEGPVNYVYVVDDYWTPQSTFSVKWDDPDLNIPWPIKNPIISNKDKEQPYLREVFPDKLK